MGYPVFAAGDVLNASDMNAVGLWLVKTQTVGTGVTSVAVTDAFTSDYANYRITYAGGTQSASNDVWIQLGSSTTGYYGVLIYSTVGTGTATVAVNDNNNRADWIGGGTAGQASFVSVDLLGPQLAAYTKIRNGSYQNDLGFGVYNGEHRVATAYTGFTVGVAAGTMTGGTIRVYGYRN